MLVVSVTYGMPANSTCCRRPRSASARLRRCGALPGPGPHRYPLTPVRRPPLNILSAPFADPPALCGRGGVRTQVNGSGLTPMERLTNGVWRPVRVAPRVNFALRLGGMAHYAATLRDYFFRLNEAGRIHLLRIAIMNT
jgi:hypothetical protein